MAQITAEPKELIKLSKWPDFHCWPTVPGLRNLYLNRKTNGFASAFKRVRATILVDEPEFYRCVEVIDAAITEAERLAAEIKAQALAQENAQ